MSYRLGIDIGGTFTDFVLVDDSAGTFHQEKRLTTPQDLSLAFFEGLDILVRDYVSDIEKLNSVLHGTTIATNMVVEKVGGKIGLLTTRGFKDTLDLRRGLRYDQYDLKLTFPAPVVDGANRREVDERISANGQVLKELNLPDALTAVKELIEIQKVEAIAICLINSYANPEHEIRLKDQIKREYPDIHVSLSSIVAPRIREYERMSTTVINAYIQPTVQEYLTRVKNGLNKRGFKGELFIITCSGGAITSEIAIDQPVLLLESGPAGGVIAADFLSKATGNIDTLAFDMGGTTAKGCVMKDGILPKAYEMEVARFHRFKKGSGLPLIVPNIKLIEIGGGGGSIAYLDSLGLIRVGPKSAGATPGPACYGLGGDKPTVTDADLVLGYLTPEYFLGGDMKLRPDLSERAIHIHVGSQLGLEVSRAAWGIHEKVNEDVAQAFRLHGAERGVDLRGYSLICSGGAAPIHAGRIAKKLNMKTLIVPFRAGVLSALGLLMTPISLDYSMSFRTKLADLSHAKYSGMFEKMSKRGMDHLLRMGVDRNEIRISRLLDMRYEGQGYDIEVLLPERSNYGEFEDLFDLYEEAYENLYLLKGISKNVEISSFKVTVMGPDPKMNLESPELQEGGDALKGHRKVYFESTQGYVDCPVYDRYKMVPGDKISGPAVVEERESTTVLQSDTSASIDKFLNIVQSL